MSCVNRLPYPHPFPFDIAHQHPQSATPAAPLLPIFHERALSGTATFQLTLAHSVINGELMAGTSSISTSSVTAAVGVVDADS